MSKGLSQRVRDKVLQTGDAVEGMREDDGTLVIIQRDRRTGKKKVVTRIKEKKRG